MLRCNGRRVGALGLVFACLMGFASAALGADAEAGKGAYMVCAACHGQQGEGNQAMGAPRIAGQEPWYLKRQMEAYQQGLRGTKSDDTYGMQMRPMAMTAADPATLDNLIAYIGTLPDTPAEPTIEGDVAAGKAAYQVCAACHGPQAEGMEQMGGPGLAGQNDWYLARQLHNYKQGLRAYDQKDIFGNQMKPMAAILASDEAINNVMAYINSLR